MKKTTALVLCGTLASTIPASGVIIAGWDAFSDEGSETYNATVVNGVTAQAVGTSTADGAGWGTWNEEGRSADGTWGTITGDVAPSTSTDSLTDSIGLRNSTNAGELTITLNNTSGSALDLTSFHFDGIARFSDSPDQWSLSILDGSAVTQQFDIASGTVENVGSMADRTQDAWDIDLTGLADTTFDDGESVIFELAFTGGVVDSTSGGHNTMIDNVAVTAVPEPSTVALISGFSMFALVLFRRFRKGKD